MPIADPLAEFHNFRLNVVALRTLECSSVIVGLFGLNASEIHPCAASRTVWMIDGFRAFCLNGFARHGTPFITGGSATGLSATDGRLIGRASVGDGYSVCLLCRLNKPASAGSSVMYRFTQESQSETRHSKRVVSIRGKKRDRHPTVSSRHDRVVDCLPKVQSRNALDWHRG
jgi:hypothetical protein